MKIPPTPTTRAGIQRLIMKVASDVGECQLRYRSRTIDAVVHDTSKKPVFSDVIISVSDQRTDEQKYLPRQWVLPDLTKLERNTLKGRAYSIILYEWKRADRKKAHKDQLVLQF